MNPAVTESYEVLQHIKTKKYYHQNDIDLSCELVTDINEATRFVTGSACNSPFAGRSFELVLVIR